MVRKINGVPGKIIKFGNSKVMSFPPGWLNDFGLNEFGAEIIKVKTPMGILTMPKKHYKEYLEAEKRAGESNQRAKSNVIENKSINNIKDNCEPVKTKKIPFIELVKSDSMTFPGDPDHILKVIPGKISDMQSQINETHKYFETRARKNFLTESDKAVVKAAFNLIALDNPDSVDGLPGLDIDLTHTINRKKLTETLHRAIDKELFSGEFLKKLEKVLESLGV